MTSTLDLDNLHLETGSHTPQSFIAAVLDAPPTDKCIPWPFAKTANGYGHLRVGGRHVRATHEVLAHAAEVRPHRAGRPAIALHSCANPPCINPRHLRWGTHAENVVDMAARDRRNDAAGAASSGARLTERDVRSIRALVEARAGTYRQIASRFGVSHVAVSNIVNRRTWAHLATEVTA